MRADAARLLAENFHSLPAVDGKRPMRMFNFAAAAHAPETASKITQAAQLAAASVIQLLEQNGYVISHKDDPTPETADPGGFPHAVIRCEHCAETILTVSRLTVDPNRPGRFHGKLHRVAIEGAGLNHQSGTHCWE